jgi:predicted kinase
LNLVKTSLVFSEKIAIKFLYYDTEMGLMDKKQTIFNAKQIDLGDINTVETAQ